MRLRPPCAPPAPGATHDASPARWVRDERRSGDDVAGPEGAQEALHGMMRMPPATRAAGLVLATSAARGRCSSVKARNGRNSRSQTCAEPFTSTATSPTVPTVDSMVTTITGNQVTVPARMVALAGMEPGTRLEWIPTDCEHVIEVRVHRNIARVAGDLRGRGAHYRKQQGSAVDRLMRDRQREDRETERR